MRNGTKLLAVAGLAFAAVQLIPVDRTAPPDEGPIAIHDAAVADLMARACADCHTNQTEWPWYSRVAPVSWWLADHVRDGREELNLSRWGAMDAERQDHKLEELIEKVEEEEMPLRSYTVAHSQARLTSAEREVLIRWARSLREELGAGEAARGTPDS